MRTMLRVHEMQRGISEGGVYYTNAMAEQRAIEEAMQPCPPKVSTTSGQSVFSGSFI